VIFSIIENDRGKGLRGDTVVPAGPYFVMGDNRDNSVDSREFGSIDQRHIIGVVN
jgi:signal peptidase I